MNIALVDDLEYDLRNLRGMLSEYFSLRDAQCRISCFLSGEQFLSSFCPGKFDAVFLDNLMEGLSGMETARQLRARDESIPIIFITTEESYALDGYTVQAADYIIKPASKERLYGVLDRLTRHKKLRHIIEIKENRMTRKLDLDHVLWVRSSGHFLEIQTMSGTLKPYMTMESFLSVLEQLGEYGESSRGLRFQNCCRGYVVCLDHVRSFTPTEFLMSDQSHVPVSRPRYKEMKTAYASYLFRQTRNITNQ